MNALTDLEADLAIANAEIEVLKAENKILRQRLDNECDSCACEIANERDSLRNELCLKCGKYREAHNGACDGCRWKGEHMKRRGRND